MSDDWPRIVAAGDRSLFVEFEERIDLGVNARTVALAKTLQAAAIAGVQDIVPAYRSVGIHFDPLRTDYQRLVDRLTHEAEQSVADAHVDHATTIVPVCYGDEFGPDLAEVASLTSLSEDEVIARHTNATYRIFMLGFVPGFAYLGPLDDRLVLPRRSTPRTHVPAGSVAIAGAQTGIYPLVTPGGWHLIGRTAMRPYDATRDAPFMFKPGDVVRFHAVSREDYERALSEAQRS